MDHWTPTRSRRVLQKIKSKPGANPTSSIDGGGMVDNVNSKISRQCSGADAALGKQRGAMNQAAKNFDTVTGIVKTMPEVDGKGVGNPDGVLRSNRILGNDARDLFAEDVKQHLDSKGALYAKKSQPVCPHCRACF